MRWLSELPVNTLAGKRVLLRLDLNVPLENGQVRDDFRIQRALPTIKKLQDLGAKIIILSHLGEASVSLAPVANYLEKFMPVQFVDQHSDIPEQTDKVILLENLRRDVGEVNNSPQLAQKLARYGDFYINEAFSASHRRHASIVSLPQLLPSAAGLEFAAEFTQLSQLFQPALPLNIVIGGAKFGTKFPLIRKFLPLADKIFVGGALAHPFFKFLGYEIGRSVCDDSVGDLAALWRSGKIVLPSEVLVQRGAEIGSAKPDQVPKDGKIVDAGPAALDQLAELVADSKTLLWNGPLGGYEQGFVGPTHDLAKLIAGQTGLHSVIGGGDTIAVLEKLNLFDQFSFVSTAGGAMLDFLAEGTLPGIVALEESEQKFPN